MDNPSKAVRLDPRASGSSTFRNAYMEITLIYKPTYRIRRCHPSLGLLNKVALPDWCSVEQEVASAHQLFVGEVQRIFDTYKGLYGWANKPLEIV